MEETIVLLKQLGYSDKHIEYLIKEDESIDLSQCTEKQIAYEGVDVVPADLSSPIIKETRKPIETVYNSIKYQKRDSV